MGSTVSNSTLFAGNSRYANDFQQVIERAVAIASLPLNSLRSSLSGLQDQSAGLTALNTKFASLQTAVQAVGTATGAASYGATVSDSGVSVAIAAGALPATYTVEVTSLGSYNTAMSAGTAPKVDDPASRNISTSTNFTLRAGAGSYAFSASNLNEMVSRINGSGLDVQASLVNVGSAAEPDYRLSVQGTKLGSLGISLEDDSEPAPQQLLDTLSAGAKASYKLNGYATESTSDTRTVEISPGVTVTLLKQSDAGQPTTVTVARKTDSVKNALSSLVAAYNAAVDEVDKNRGQGGGALAGQSIVYIAGQALSDLQDYLPDSGPFTSLADLGLTTDQSGHLAFDSAVFDKAAEGRVGEVMTFFEGFQKSASGTLDSLEDPYNGQMQNALSGVNAQIATTSDRISQQQDRINQLRLDLNSRMAAADALIASLEQQALYMSNLIQSMLASNSSSR
ncbi:MAG: flagellar filament capping protein FliD [Acidobacteriota bacterium]